MRYLTLLTTMNPAHCKRAVAFILALLIFACGSAEDYQKEKREGPAPLTGEVALRIPLDQQHWARSMTEQMAAAKLARDLGDTVTCLRKADSLLWVGANMLDTISVDAPLHQFLLLYMADGYAKLRAWHTSEDSVAALTHRFEDMVARMKQRRDSANPTR